MADITRNNGARNAGLALLAAVGVGAVAVTDPPPLLEPSTPKGR